MTRKKSPLKDAPLRSPGQSIEERRTELITDKLVTPFIAVGMLFSVAIVEWTRYLNPSPPMPWIFTAIFAAGAIFLAIRIWTLRGEMKRLKQARDGERAVGQFLDKLRAKGYEVFHDVQGSGFNLDHVLIGPAGVFTVETKTWSKPASGSPELTFNGESISIGHWSPPSSPLVQCHAQASWLQTVLEASTGRKFAVMPVLLFPGWFVKQTCRPDRPIWVLNPKALPQFLERRDVVLKHDEIKLASFHLSRFIRREAAAS